MQIKPQHAAAHIITSLNAEHGIGPWHEPHGTVHNVVYADEKNPGVMKHARLGASGLQLIRGDIAVCIPLELLFALAAEINPAFDAPPSKELSAADVAAIAKEILPAAESNSAAES